MTRARSALLDIIGQKLPLCLLILGVVFLVTGFCDVDWMVNQFHNSNWGHDTWWFNTWLEVEWWDAYAVSIIRVIVGAWLIGWCSNYFNSAISQAYYKERYWEMVAKSKAFVSSYDDWDQESS